VAYIIKIFVTLDYLVIMDKKSERVSLSKLYKSESIRNTVWDVLSEDFDDSFNRIMDDGKNLQSLLVKKAKARKILIKELVIEYGYQLETLDDLKSCLDALKTCDTVDEADSSIFFSKTGNDEVDCGCKPWKERLFLNLTKARVDNSINSPHTDSE